MISHFGQVNTVFPKEEPLWSDKKRPLFGLPLSFTYFKLFSDRLIVKRGLLICRQEEVRLYRIVDISVRQSIFQRLFGIGSISVLTVDRSAPKCLIASVKHPYEVSRYISDLAEVERRNVGIGFFESM